MAAVTAYMTKQPIGPSVLQGMGYGMGASLATSTPHNCGIKTQ